MKFIERKETASILERRRKHNRGEQSMMNSGLACLRILGMFLSFASFALSGVGVREEPIGIIVRNKRLTVVLSKGDNGAIVSLTDNATGQEFIAKQVEPCLFRLVFTKKGDVSGAAEIFTSGDAGEVEYSVEEGQKTIAVLRFGQIGGRKIEATCTASVAQGDPLVRWRISVRCFEPLVLEEIQFPVMMISVPVGESVEDDAAVFGLTTGGIFRPGKWSIGQYMLAKQPGTLGAQFGCYYDAKAGLYTATYDSKGYPKCFAMSRVTEGVEVAWKHLCFYETNEPYELDYEVVFTTFQSKDETVPTDWRDAADIYKEWALKQPWCAQTIEEREDIPAWIKNGFARIPAFLRGDQRNISSVVEWLERYWNKYFSPATPVVSLYGWEKVWYWVSPKYFPFYPSDGEFHQLVEKLHKLGAYVFLWPSGYQWTLTFRRRADGTFEWDDRADFDKTGRPHAIVKRDGSIFTNAYPWLEGGENAALCRGDAWSREFLNDLVAKIVERGADAVQMDQVVGGQWPAWGETPCFSRSHGHPPGYGLWDVEAFHKQMKSMRKRCVKINPEVVFSMEQPQELFIPHFGFLDYRQVQTITETPDRDPASVFAYLYHEFVPLFTVDGAQDAVSAAYCLVNGEIPCISLGQTEMPGHPVIANGEFEEWENGSPSHWLHIKRVGNTEFTGKICRDEKEKHSGQFSLKLKNERKDDVASLKKLIPVDGRILDVNKTYRVRLWLKSSGVQQENFVIVATYDKDIDTDWRLWKETGRWHIEIPHQAEWTEKSITFTVPEGSRNLNLYLNLKGEGTVWFDDVMLEEVKEDGSVREVLLPETPLFKVLRQWVQLISGEGRPFLLLGRMLRPPHLLTEKTKHTFSSGRQIQPYVLMQTYSSDWEAVGSWSVPIPLVEETWEQRSVQFTIPEGSAHCHIFLHFENIGEFWFDDFTLTEVGSEHNLIHNGGFEEWQDPSAPPDGWMHIKSYQGKDFTGIFYRDDEEKHSGKFAIKLVNDTDDDIVQVKQVLPVDGKILSVGKTYRLSFWVKVRGVSHWKRVSLERELPAILHNAFRAPDGREAVIAVNITDKPKTGKLNWQGKDIDLRLAPWEATLLTEANESARDIGWK